MKSKKTANKITKEYIEENYDEFFGNINIRKGILKSYNITPEEFYCIYHEVKEPINSCQNCGNPTKFINFKRGYRQFCSTTCGREYKSKHTESLKDTDFTLEYFEKNKEKIFNKNGNINSSFISNIGKTSEDFYNLLHPKESKNNKCKICNKATKFVSFKEGYASFCSNECKYIYKSIDDQAPKKQSNTILNKTEEEKKAITLKSKITKSKRTTVEIEAEKNKRKKSMEKRSIKDKLKSLTKRRNTYHNRTEEQKSKTREKNKKTYLNRTEEQKLQTREKYKNTWAKKSTKELKNISKTRADSISNKTKEQKLQTREKYKSTWAKKSTEELKEIKSKKRASYYKKSTEELKEIRKKRSNTWKHKNKKELEVIHIERSTRYQSKSDEEKTKIITKRIESHKNRSLEDINESNAKRRKTNLTKYGDEFHTMNNFKYKDYKKGDIIVKVQGYEPYMLDLLLEHTDPEDILTDRTDMPKIEYNINGKVSRYFPDIFLPKQNKIIEVKSTYTITIDKPKIKAKGDACISLGYEYEIWVFNAKGDVFDVIKY